MTCTFLNIGFCNPCMCWVWKTPCQELTWEDLFVWELVLFYILLPRSRLSEFGRLLSSEKNGPAGRQVWKIGRDYHLRFSGLMIEGGTSLYKLHYSGVRSALNVLHVFRMLPLLGAVASIAQEIGTTRYCVSWNRFSGRKKQKPRYCSLMFRLLIGLWHFLLRFCL